MSVQLTWRTYTGAAGLLLVLFVALPASLWMFSNYRAEKLKSEVRALVPDIIESTNGSITAAKDILATEAAAGTEYRAYNVYTTRIGSSREAINKMCAEIENAIRRSKEGLYLDQNFCSLYIQETDGGFAVANRHSANPVNYVYDLQDLGDLKISPESWKLYPNNRYWRVKYKLSENPYIVLDFGLVERDYQY